MASFPSHFDFSAGLVAVIGSSPVAMTSLQTLRSAGASVRWYCRDLDVATTVLLASPPPGRIELSLADPSLIDVREFIAVVAADGSSQDREIAVRARAAHVPVCVPGQPVLSNFALPPARSWFGARRRESAALEIAA